MIRLFLAALGVCVLGATVVPVRAQADRSPSARLIPAPALAIPTAVDSSTPMAWDLVDGAWTLFAFASWGGVPSLLAGPQLDHLQRIESITLVPHPGNGVWMEAVVPDEVGTWYEYYHHEVPAFRTRRSSVTRGGGARRES